MAEREASGDFDYLFDDPADADGLTGHAPAFDPEAPQDLDSHTSPDDDLWDDPDDNFWDRDAESANGDHFDAFDTKTWYFTPAPTPWYRTKHAMTALIAAAAAMVAIVVSGVLLVFRAPGNTDDSTTSVTPTAPTSAAPASAAPTSAAADERSTDERSTDERRRWRPASSCHRHRRRHRHRHRRRPGDLGLVGQHRARRRLPESAAAGEQGARDRRNPYACHPVTDQRRSAAAAPTQLKVRPAQGETHPSRPGRTF